MKSNQRVVLLPLLGGFGNQLFQVAAALHNNPEGKIQLISDLGHQRRNLFGKPDLESFSLPENVLSSKNSVNHVFCTRAFNALLKSGISESKSWITSAPMKMICKVILCFHSKTIVRFHISKGVGFWKWTTRSFRQMAIGYFQSYVWSDDNEVYRKISLIRVLNPSVNLQKLEKHFQSNYVIAVHVRLSDYVNEPTIGVLDKKYYEKALEKITNLRGKEIWLFSDDPKSALELMPSRIRDNCTSIMDFGLTSSEEWQLMRYADEFFISNSTFSWWAARLAFKSQVKVYAPSPWFAKGPQPQKLLPSNWQEVERF